MTPPHVGSVFETADGDRCVIIDRSRIFDTWHLKAQWLGAGRQMSWHVWPLDDWVEIDAAEEALLRFEARKAAV